MQRSFRFCLKFTRAKKERQAVLLMNVCSMIEMIELRLAQDVDAKAPFDYARVGYIARGEFIHLFIYFAFFFYTVYQRILSANVDL